jgi:AraC-like DNA-binding protein
MGLDVRTLERRFSEQFRTTPKTWIARERMSLARSLLANGLSNKEVAASLNYTCEANFCRAFKRYFDCAPQKFARSQRTRVFPLVSRFDRELSPPDKPAELPSEIASTILQSCHAHALQTDTTAERKTNRRRAILQTAGVPTTTSPYGKNTRNSHAGTRTNARQAVLHPLFQRNEFNQT